MEVQHHLCLCKISHWEVISVPFFPCLSKIIQNVLKLFGLHISNQRDVNDQVFVTEHKHKVSLDRCVSMYHHVTNV